VISTSFVACKAVRGGDPSLDGSIGFKINSYTYADTVSRGPEAIRLSDETLSFGFNTNLYVVSCLNFSASNCGFDYAAEYSVRVTSTNGGCVIENCWIAATNDVGENAKGITLDDLGVASQLLTKISGNFISGYGTPDTATDSWGIYVGNNRVGVIIKDNQVASGIGIGLYLNGSGSRKHTIENNQLGGTLYSLWQVVGGGHYIKQNRLDAAIACTTLSAEVSKWENNHGSAVTCFHGFVSTPSGSTSNTYAMVADLGLPAAPITAAPGNLRLFVRAQQVAGSATRGDVRAYISGTDIVVTNETSVGVTNSDIWLDMEPY
jgi:hypothetical protein